LTYLTGGNQIEMLCLLRFVFSVLPEDHCFYYVVLHQIIYILGSYSSLQKIIYTQEHFTPDSNMAIFLDIGILDSLVNIFLQFLSAELDENIVQRRQHGDQVTLPEWMQIGLLFRRAT